MNLHNPENLQNDVPKAKEMSKKACSRGHWRPHEDAKLTQLVAQFGPHNWNLIALKLHARSGLLFIYLFLYSLPTHKFI